MWNVARIRANVFSRAGFSFLFFFISSFLGTQQTRVTPAVCVFGFLNYSAGGVCMCFVSFVLNLGSVSLSESL